ncbi:hypothetical protein BLNAU_21528 [Blattamonas nauphoetae]|uniref:Uncharacterized protein n=1 Tax=Blattamonas nauphoetae TaxID=2049346 RepID=A0ABQ9WYQ7_9EUKA|nr:hypothetical protein BLNAU_21528 [Blattamonas nauphoetae]
MGDTNWDGACTKSVHHATSETSRGMTELSDGKSQEAAGGKEKRGNGEDEHTREGGDGDCGEGEVECFEFLLLILRQQLERRHTRPVEWSEEEERHKSTEAGSLH